MIVRYIVFVVITLLLCYSCSRENKEYLFSKVSAEHSGLYFNNVLANSDSQNIIQNLYHYNGGGVAIGDVNNDTLPDIYLTSNQGENKLYLNQGGLQFRDITAVAFPSFRDDWSTGVTMADVNNDGWMDIYTSVVSEYKGYKGRNRLWINQGDLTFVEADSSAGLVLQIYGTQAAFFDYDKDGDLDVYLLCQSFKDSEVFRDTSMRRTVDDHAGDRLFQNQLMETGRLGFRDVTVESGIYSSAVGFGLGLSISDVNHDGWPDIYVGNDFHENDYLYINSGNGLFLEESKLRIPHGSTFSMGNDIADIDNDGQLDIMTLDMKPEDYQVYKSSSGIDEFNVYDYKLKFGYQNQYSQNCLLVNQGNGAFADRANAAGIGATDWSWSVLLEDYDQDGLKDVFVSNGIAQRPNDLDYLNFMASELAKDDVADEVIAASMPEGKVPNYLFQNKGNVQFENASNRWYDFDDDLSNGAAASDLDLDGDVDLVINRINEEVLFLENKAQGSNYLTVDVIPELRAQFLGAKVKVYVDGKGQIEEIKSTRGFQSASEAVAYFGLGDVAHIDSVVIDWPNSSITVLEDVQSNQRIFVRPGPKNNHTTTSTSVTSLVSIEKLNKIHEDESDIELSSNRLTPWSRSTRGPLMEVSPSRGLQLYPFSVYAVMSQRNPGVDFSRMHQFRFTETGAGYLQGVKINNIDLGMVNDAVWEDMNNDGRADLVIAAEWQPIQVLFNLPQGFQLSSLPNSSGLWRSIAVSDIDGDGIKDIVAGNMGTNLPITASHEYPLKLYVGDYNDNGAPLPILAHHVDDEWRVYETRNILGAAIPKIKKKYQDYHSFSNANLNDVFGEVLDTVSQYEAAIMESKVFFGNEKGEYKFVSLPSDAQITCINDILVEDINRDGMLDLVLAGNLYEMTPSLGRLDGSAVQVLYNTGDRSFTTYSGGGAPIDYIQGQARHLLKVRDGEILVSFHNANVRSLRY